MTSIPIRSEHKVRFRPALWALLVAKAKEESAPSVAEYVRKTMMGDATGIADKVKELRRLMEEQTFPILCIPETPSPLDLAAVPASELLRLHFIMGLV